MKRMLFGLAAVIALGAAAPAMARDPGDWGYRHSGGYGHSNGLDWRYDRVLDRIQDGVRDGVLNRYQARKLSDEVNQMRARADWDARRGVDDRYEMSDRLARLEQRIRVLYDRGADRVDDDRRAYAERGPRWR